MPHIPISVLRGKDLSRAQDQYFEMFEAPPTTDDTTDDNSDVIDDSLPDYVVDDISDEEGVPVGTDLIDRFNREIDDSSEKDFSDDTEVDHEEESVLDETLLVTGICSASA